MPESCDETGNLQLKNENDWNRVFCHEIGGRLETRHTYTYPIGKSYVRVDCETEEYVWEGGRDDKRSSLDSVQQALFFSYLTGKKPGVVIYNTDGQIGKLEHQIKTICDLAHITFLSYPE